MGIMRKINTFWRYYLKLRYLFIPDSAAGDGARGSLYRPFLKKCGKNFKVAANAFIYNPNGLSAGNNVYIGFNSYLGQGEVFLDDEVLIGNFVSITASNHIREGDSYRFGGFEPKPIHIGKGTWIAAHSCILAGTTIGKGCLVAAGAVVTKSFEDNTVIGGVPAKVIKKSDVV